MERIKMGIIGTGFIARIHMEAMQGIIGKKVDVVAVAARNEEKLQEFADEFGIAQIYTDLNDLLANKDIQVVDICTPTDVHTEIILAAAATGKHIICEKPLSGYFGKELDIELVGEEVSREIMYKEIIDEIEKVKGIIEKNNVKFMYAENWIYSPPFLKMRRLLNASGGTILDIRAEESHSGSHAIYSRKWKQSGGGSLLRLGAHPIGAVLYLKYLEGVKNGKEIMPASITCEVSNNTKIPAVLEEDVDYLVKGWEDVEDWAAVVISFTDGSKAVIMASDCVLGGIKDEMTVYTTNSVIKLDMSHSNMITAFAPEDGVFKDEYITEKTQTRAGWSNPSPGEDWVMGYSKEMEDFIDCILEDREPVSNFFIAAETMKVIYAGYLAAEKGCKVKLR